MPSGVNTLVLLLLPLREQTHKHALVPCRWASAYQGCKQFTKALKVSLEYNLAFHFQRFFMYPLAHILVLQAGSFPIRLL